MQMLPSYSSSWRNLCSISRGCFNIKMLSYQYRDPHDNVKTVSTARSLTWEFPYIGNTIFKLTCTCIILCVIFSGWCSFLDTPGWHDNKLFLILISLVLVLSDKHLCTLDVKCFVAKQFMVVNMINLSFFNVANRADLASNNHGASSSKLVGSLWYINDRHNTAHRRPSLYSGIPRNTLYQHRIWFRFISWLERQGNKKLVLKSNIINWAIVHNEYLNAMRGTTKLLRWTGYVKWKSMSYQSYNCTTLWCLIQSINVMPNFTTETDWL